MREGTKPERKAGREEREEEREREKGKEAGETAEGQHRVGTSDATLFRRRKWRDCVGAGVGVGVSEEGGRALTFSRSLSFSASATGPEATRSHLHAWNVGMIRQFVMTTPGKTR